MSNLKEHPDVQELIDTLDKNGLKKIAEITHKYGMKFLVWFEPERVRPGTWLWEKHPEFLLFFKGDPDDRRHNNAIYDLATGECLQLCNEDILRQLRLLGRR